MHKFYHKSTGSHATDLYFLNKTVVLDYMVLLFYFILLCGIIWFYDHTSLMVQVPYR